MAKTLIIKGADFSRHYVDRVVFSDIPCTGITIDRNSIVLTSTSDFQTIAATVTPIDTTDAVIWTSSDSNIVDVNNGVVRGVGIGTATVTAQCGDFTATCSVTTSAVVDFEYSAGAWISPSANRNFVTLDSNSATNGFMVGATSGTYHATDVQPTAGWLYPVMVPKNAVSISVRCLSRYYGVHTMAFTNSNVESTHSGTVAYASYVYGRSGTGWGDKTYNGQACWGNDIDIPAGCDSVVIGFRDYGSVSTPETAAANTHIWFNTSNA